MAFDPKRMTTGYPAEQQPFYGAAPRPLFGGPPPPAYDGGAAAARPVYYAASYQPPRASNLLRRLLIVAAGAIIAAGTITFIVWLILRPRLPIFSLDSASLSSFNVSSSQVSSDLSLSFSVRNPNKKLSVHYDHVWVGFLYKYDTLSEDSLPPFDQRTGNVTELKARLVEVMEYVGDKIAKEIEDERSLGVVGFQVRVAASVRFSSGALWTRRNVLKVYCNDVRIRFVNATANSGSLMGSPKPCHVDLMKYLT